jgi:hypothetical protein
MTPHEVELIVSYGECSGYCTTILRVSGTRLTLILVSDDVDDPNLEFTGQASESWALQTQRALDSLGEQNLETVYGKPDSRDEGAATVRIVREGSVSEHTYSATDPPPPLSELHGILDDVRLAWVDGEHVPGVSFDSHPPPSQWGTR